MGVKKKISLIWLFLSVLVLVGCDGGAVDDSTFDVSTNQIDMQIRAPRAILAGNQPLLTYSVSVNGILQASGQRMAGSSQRIQVNYNQGDTVSYNFEWHETVFGVRFASTSGTIVPNGVSSVVVSDWVSEDADSDLWSNFEEYQEGTSPLSDADRPDFSITPFDNRRSYMESRNWSNPVFGCRNNANTATWYWILNSNGSISGIETDAIGNSFETTNRGSWFDLAAFGIFDAIEITNEREEVFDWGVSENSAELRLLNFNWGWCVRLAGPVLF